VRNEELVEKAVITTNDIAASGKLNPAQGSKSPLEAGSLANTIKSAVEQALTPVVTELAEVKKSNDETRKLNEGLQDKIKQLESMRGVSKSLEGTEDDPEKPTKKSKSLFAGLV